MDNRGTIFLEYSVLGGIFSSIGSMFGKLSGTVEGHDFLTILCFITMVGFNTLGMLYFTKGLQRSPTSLHATLASSASNYISTAILGSILFEEKIPLIWWCGTTFIVAGIAVMSYPYSFTFPKISTD